MVRPRVVHTGGDWSRTNGGRLRLARRRHCRAATRGLHEARRAVLDDHRLLDVVEGDGREGGGDADRHRGGADHPAAGVAGHDLAVFDVDPRRQPVGEPEAVGESPRVEVVDAVGQGLVVVGDAHFERSVC